MTEKGEREGTKLPLGEMIEMIILSFWFLWVSTWKDHSLGQRHRQATLQNHVQNASSTHRVCKMYRLIFLLAMCRHIKSSKSKRLTQIIVGYFYSSQDRVKTLFTFTSIMRHSVAGVEEYNRLRDSHNRASQPNQCLGSAVPCRHLVVF